MALDIHLTFWSLPGREIWKIHRFLRSTLPQGRASQVQETHVVAAREMVLVLRKKSMIDED